jgi:hypothetical protein
LEAAFQQSLKPVTHLMGSLQELRMCWFGRAISKLAAFCICLITLVLVSGLFLAVRAGQQSTNSSNAVRQLGTIEGVSGKTITLKTDAGKEVPVQVLDAARIVRVEPGQKDLKNATRTEFDQLHIGDRILVRGMMSEDGQSLEAAAIIAIKKADIAQKQEQEREDWQKRGVGGLVSAVDPAANTVTISVATLGVTKKILIQLSKDTLIRRYAPDSVRFDAAKPGTINEIKIGDQLRALGNRNPDDNEVTAEAVVSGTFRNIAGTINSIDPADGTLSVMDLFTKKPVQVRFTTDSQIHKLPQMLAQMIAFRLKGAQAGGEQRGESSPGSQHPSGPPAAGAGRAAGPGEGSWRGGNGEGGHGSGDLQQMLNRMPAATLADFQRGDAVMLVTTLGAGTGPVTAVTLLGGVEPILAAAPHADQASFLSPWNIGGGSAAASGEAAGAP